MKFFLSIISTMYFLMNISSIAHAEIELWDWGINIDGTTYCLEGPCDYDFFAADSLDSLADLPPSVDYSDFDLSDDVSTKTGLGVLVITITGTGEHSVSVYLNYDIDFLINGYVNETGSRVGTLVPGLSWEIDEIGWGELGSLGTAGIPYLGNIFDNFIDSGLQIPPRSLLDNRIFYNDFSGQGLEPPIEDAALAKSWDFDLCEGETAIITFAAGTVEPASGFYLVQQDSDSGTNVYFTSEIVFDASCSGTVDCLGISNGTAVEDNCGVCDDDSTNDCIQDCDGTWGGTAYIDNCNICVGGDTGLTACEQDCADVWGGDAVVDDCGVCGGDNSSCADCNGVPNGTAYIDNCSACVGGDTGLTACEQDCADVWGGDAVVDDCGVCDADPANDCSQKSFPWTMYLNIIVNSAEATK